jgi:hypothetical protein
MHKDVLKYWKVVRMWVKLKYNLTQADLDILLFIHSEGYFSRREFEHYHDLMTWDEKRFKKLMRDGWIILFRKGNRGRRSIYKASTKTNMVVRKIYNILYLEEEIAETRNPAFNKNTGFANKMLRKNIIKLNNEVKELRLRRAQESQDEVLTQEEA